MFYSAISTLRLIFIACRTLFIVSTSRFHSWALPLNGIFIVHCSFFIGVIMVANVTVLCDPNVAGDHFVCEKPFEAKLYR